jgi:guanylate kinase
MNELAHIAEFRSVLDGYNLSNRARAILKQTKLVILTAASASGRNTIIGELLRTDEYYFIVSDTTRQPRKNNGLLEVHGREYWIRTEQAILDDLKRGEFLEAEVIHGQQVSGISIRELEAANASNKIAVADVDIGGVHNIMRLKPDTVPILVLPPSFDEWQRRIRGRGNMPEAEFKRRLQTSARIFQEGLINQKFRIVINDKLERAAIAVHQIVTLDQIDQAEQDAGRRLIEQLLADTKLLLTAI